VADGHDYRLAPESPCRAENSPCGAVIGAYEEPCGATSGAPQTPGSPRDLARVLEAPSPNPAGSSVQCRLALPSAGTVRVEVLDAAGARVREIENADLSSGTHAVDWDLTDQSGRRVAAGVYWLRASTPWGSDSRPVVITK
ncbi:MAG: hypothetical protein KC729_17775, partial [Candidatus Eisenbacteria bacterium]|nr:hypothetical protein [Candidatus Eisenbacteria bacterium]